MPAFSPPPLDSITSDPISPEDESSGRVAQGGYKIGATYVAQTSPEEEGFSPPPLDSITSDPDDEGFETPLSPEEQSRILKRADLLFQQRAARAESKRLAYSQKEIETVEQIVAGIAQTFSDPIGTGERLAYQAAEAIGVPKALIPQKTTTEQIGTALDYYGHLAKAGLQDIAVLFSPTLTDDDRSTLLGNIAAAARDETTPYEKATLEVEGWSGVLRDIANTTVEMLPRIVATRLGARAGLQENVSAGVAFGLSEEGLDPQTALTMGIFPTVGKFGRELAEKTATRLGMNFSSRAGLEAFKMAGSLATSQAYIDLLALPEYINMPPEKRLQAWARNAGINLAFHLPGISGLARVADQEKQISRAFEQSLENIANYRALVSTSPRREFERETARPLTELEHLIRTEEADRPVPFVAPEGEFESLVQESIERLKSYNAPLTAGAIEQSIERPARAIPKQETERVLPPVPGKPGEVKTEVPATERTEEIQPAQRGKPAQGDLIRPQIQKPDKLKGDEISEEKPQEKEELVLTPELEPEKPSPAPAPATPEKTKETIEEPTSPTSSPVESESVSSIRASMAKLERKIKKETRLEIVRKLEGKLQAYKVDIFLEKWRAETAASRGQGETQPPQIKITGKILETQKEFLMDAVNDAIKTAPEEWDKNNKITFEVPGDGTFTVLNNKHSLVVFADLVKKHFPTTPARAEYPKPRAPRVSPTAPPKVKEPDAQSTALVTGEFSSKDQNRPSILYPFSDGTRLISTDGRQVIIIPGNFGGTKETPIYIDPETGLPITEAQIIKLVGPPAKGEPITPPTPPTIDFLLQKKENLLFKDVDTAKLFNLINQAAKLTTKEITGIELRRTKDGQIATASRLPELGEFESAPDTELIGKFNANYLRDIVEAARNLGNETVDISVGGERPGEDPLVVSGKNFKYFLMPHPREKRPTPAPPEPISKTPVPTPAPPEPGPEAPLESRIPGLGKRPTKTRDIFEMDEGDLADYLDARFGDQPSAPGSPLTVGRRGDYFFPTYDEFKTWMDARYAERDHEGMRIAFAEAPTENKVKYIKENRRSLDHKNAWITNLATGAILPVDDPPVARTTPRPLPGGGVQPVASAPPPGRRQQPPPPPRSPTPYLKFDTMILVQLLRLFSRFPKVNSRLMRAYARYVPGARAIEIKERLLWDMELAERVLSHEVGHFIDLAITIKGSGLPFAKRLKPLHDFRNQIGMIKHLRNEARSLSRQWRGPFSDGDRYRDTAQELFADFMSAMFNKPEWVNQQYPKLHDAFKDLFEGKPEFGLAYEEMTSWLSGGTVAKEFVAQKREAVRRTIDELIAPKPGVRQRLKDWLAITGMTIWHRAWQKEKFPRHIGSAISDQLEYSHTWAAVENFVTAERFTKEVQPHIDKVDPDPVVARGYLDAYNQARRTIEERRAAGVWIEQNPDAARILLTALLAAHPAFSGKFRSALASASNAQLYDLAGAIFREAWDLGDKFVDKLEKEIDSLDLGVKGQSALLAFNVRGKLLNPGGLNVEGAHKALDVIRQKLLPEQWQALETSAKNLRAILFGTQESAFNEGLIPADAWNEILLPNANNYVPYAALDLWGGRVGAGIMPQKGTTLDIADTTLAAQLKIAAINAKRQRQLQVKLLRDIYAIAGAPVPLGQRLKKASDLQAIRLQHRNDDISRFVLYSDGKPYLIEFGGDPGKTFEKAAERSNFYSQLEWLASAGKLSGLTMQLFTKFSLPFMLIRNPSRGAHTSILRVGFKAFGRRTLSPEKLSEAILLSRNYAASAFGEPALQEVINLVKKRVLLPPRYSTAMLIDQENLRDIVETGGILAYQLNKFRDVRWPIWQVGEFGRQAFIFTEKLFTAYEAFEKIQTYYAGMERGLAESKSIGLAIRGGIPKPGIGGRFFPIMEIFLTWARVHIQGVRSTIDVLRDPELRGGFAARTIATEALPRLLNLAVGSGLMYLSFSWLTGSDDEDESDPVMAQVYKRISPYKLALDNIMPINLYDPITGNYHYFNEFKSGSSIPEHYEVVSFRKPSSEEGRLWGVLLYNVLSSIPGMREKIGQPGVNPWNAFSNWIKNNMMPGINPMIKTGRGLVEMIGSGKNPPDDFRGAPSANPMLFDAGGVERAQAIAGYVMNNLGGPGELAAMFAMNTGLLDKRAISSLKKRLATDKTPLVERIPVLRSLISYDNYATYRDEKEIELAEKTLRTRARLVMSEEVRALYDFWWRNNGRKDKLNAVDRTRLAISSAFVNKLWGDLRTPGTFYSRAGHAVGPNGSKYARQSLRRDIDAVAASLVASFKAAPELAKEHETPGD